MARKKKQETFDALGGFEAETPAQSGRLARAAMWIAGSAIVLGGTYVGLTYYAQDKVPTDTTVLGVQIGGLDHAGAVEKLETNLGPRLAEPLAVEGEGVTAEISPEDAGLGVNYEATVQSVTGLSWDPRDLWRHVTGAGELEPVLDIDRTALNRAITDITPNMEVDPVDGAVDLSTGAPQIKEPVEGVTLDVPASVDVVADVWPRQEGPIELVTTLVEPDISAADIDAAMEEFVQPILSGPIQLAIRDTTHSVSTEEMARASALVPTDAGTLELQVNGEEIRDRILAESPELGTTGADARFVFEEGRPVIVPSETGLGLDVEAVAVGVREAALSGTRSTSVALTEMDAEFTTADAEALGIVEVISEFKTPYPYDPPRTQNLRAGTANVNGTLVMPGGTFSLLEVLRPITAGNGYVSSGVVEAGVASEAMGGGLSQISTTTYNAAYFAGMDITEHKPHSRWFSRYPEGREATLWDATPGVDMKFQNNTPYGVLMQAWVQDDGVVVRAWSTKHFEVESYTSPRRNITSPQVIYNERLNCIAERGGQGGFTVDVTRVRSVDGAEFDRTTNTWTYSPWNRVVCGSEPPPAPPAPPEAPAEPPAEEPPAEGEGGGEG
ncbi:MAG: VanW family protein [bacterium]|nr:VanW family protein [bacterium]